MREKKTILCTVLVIFLMVSLSGCTTYYQVTDPTTDDVYYSTSVKKLSGGAVQIKDKKTGNEVTLQNSEVKKIEKEEFNQGIYAK